MTEEKSTFELWAIVCTVCLFLSWILSCDSVVLIAYLVAAASLLRSYSETVLVLRLFTGALTVPGVVYVKMLARPPAQ